MKNYKDQFGVEIQLNYPTKKKLVKSGCLVEVYQFGNDILLGRKRHKSDSGRRSLAQYNTA